MELDPAPVVWKGYIANVAKQEVPRTANRLDRYYPELYLFSPRPEYEQDRSKYPA